MTQELSFELIKTRRFPLGSESSLECLITMSSTVTHYTFTCSSFIPTIGLIGSFIVWHFSRFTVYITSHRCLTYSFIHSFPSLLLSFFSSCLLLFLLYLYSFFLLFFFFSFLFFSRRIVTTVIS